MTAITTVKKEKSNKYVQREQQDLHASVLRLGNMADLSPETLKEHLYFLMQQFKQILYATKEEAAQVRKRNKLIN